MAKLTSGGNIPGKVAAGLNKGKLLDSNSLAFGKSKSVSFAEQLAEVRKTGDSELIKDAKGKIDKNKGDTSALDTAAQADPKAAKLKAKKGKILDKQEALKEQNKQAVAKDEIKETLESHSKNRNSEAEIAQAAQANKKAQDDAKVAAGRDDAVGNSHQEQKQQESNERQHQLANWGLLTPRIIEDIQNKAVRLDLPGVQDLEAIIVRMAGSGVSIQAVGSKETMRMLKRGEGALRQGLSKKKVRLVDVDTYFANQQTKQMEKVA